MVQPLIIYPGVISIHAPRGRGDSVCGYGVCVCRYFNPRPSREGRRGKEFDANGTARFQSTPLAGGATTAVKWKITTQEHFNPRPSREGRP